MESERLRIAEVLRNIQLAPRLRKGNSQRYCLRARHDRGAPAVPLAKELAERDSFASRDSCVFLALSA
jgi:hypothetical protein